MQCSLKVQVKVISHAASGRIKHWRGELYGLKSSFFREHDDGVLAVSRGCLVLGTFSWVGFLCLSIFVLDLISHGVQAQGIYAVTRRVRIHPGLGVFLPPVTNVVVNTQPLPNAAGQGQMQGQGGLVGQTLTRPVFVRAELPVDKEEVSRKTLEFQQRRALEGSAFAQFDMAMRYLNGDGVASDRKEARRLLELAAKGGNTRAKRELEKQGWNVVSESNSITR